MLRLIREVGSREESRERGGERERERERVVEGKGTPPKP